MAVTELPIPGAGFVLILRPGWRSCRQDGLQQAVCYPDQPHTRRLERLRRQLLQADETRAAQTEGLFDCRACAAA